MKKFFYKFLSAPQISIVLRRILENNFKRQKEIIEKHFFVTEGDTVLDLGCGTGEFSVFFPKKSYVGVDIDSKNIEYAKENYDKKFLVADGKKLPFEDNVFSKVLVIGVFHHLSDADSQAVLKEIRRVLKPGGKFLVMEDTKNKNPLTALLHYLDQGEFIRSSKNWYDMFSKEWKVLQNFTFQNRICFYSAFLLEQ